MEDDGNIGESGGIVGPKSAKRPGWDPPPNISIIRYIRYVSKTEGYTQQPQQQPRSVFFETMPYGDVFNFSAYRTNPTVICHTCNGENIKKEFFFNNIFFLKER